MSKFLGGCETEEEWREYREHFGWKPEMTEFEEAMYRTRIGMAFADGVTIQEIKGTVERIDLSEPGEDETEAAEGLMRLLFDEDGNFR